MVELQALQIELDQKEKQREELLQQLKVIGHQMSSDYCLFGQGFSKLRFTDIAMFSNPLCS